MSQTIIQPKQSKAIPIWLSLIAVVLVCLFLQVNHNNGSYNFLIEGGSDAAGAQVSVDGKMEGTIVQQAEPGVKVIALRLNLADGEHLIEISKPGFQTQKSRVFLKGEDYLAVDLKKQ